MVMSSKSHNLRARMKQIESELSPLEKVVFAQEATFTLLIQLHGFGYQHQLVPGMRPGTPLMPNMFVPLVQGHQVPWPGCRRANAIPMQQGPQPVIHPLMRNFFKIHFVSI